MINECVILAAGYSSRCKTNKMVLPLGDRSIIEQCILSFYPFCTNIIVVTGHYHNELCEILMEYKKVNIVYNQFYKEGMFSSVKLGVSLVTGDRFFIIPGDYPLIKTETIEQLLSLNADLVKPMFEGLSGHPILLKNNLIKRILTWQNTSLRDCLHDIPFIHKEVSDRGVIIDVDTIDDYMNILNGSFIL